VPASPHFDVARDLAELRTAFPSWRVWLSDEGHWYATRWRAVQPASGQPYRQYRMVDGLDAVRLLAKLNEQTARDAAAAQALL
jgi:hypothetical protein